MLFAASLFPLLQGVSPGPRNIPAAIQPCCFSLCPGKVMGLEADTAFLPALFLSQMPNTSEVGELILKPLTHQKKRLHLSY